ncbi:MAG: hypothetical protein RR696_09990, partial [Clostridia bacterium]
GGALFKDLNGFRPVAVGEIIPGSNPPVEQTLNTQLKQFRDAAANFSVVVTDPAKLAVGSSLVAEAAATEPNSPTNSSVWQVAAGNYEDYRGGTPPGAPPAARAGRRGGGERRPGGHHIWCPYRVFTRLLGFSNRNQR